MRLPKPSARIQRSHLCREAKLSLCLALMLIPGVAFAGHMSGPGSANAWTIYAFANGNVLHGILTSASALVKSSEFRDLLEFLALMGLLGTIIAAGFSGGGGRKIAGVFIAATFFLTAGLGTTTNVVIDDTVSGYVSAVPNVPILVALPEAIVSTAGHELARLMDTFYAVPGDLTVTGGNAFNIASALTQASTRVHITDPLLRASIAAFAQNCIVPAIAAGRLSAYRLTTSTQLWGNGGTLAGVNPAPLTPVYTDTQPRGVIMPCTAAGAPAGITAVATNNSPSITEDGAYEYISQYIQIAAPQWFAQSAGAWSGTAAYSWLSSSLASAQSYLFGGAMTQSTGETIQQAAAINVLSPALNAAAIASGQSQSVAALAVAQGETSQVSSWATAVDLFRDLSGYIYSVLQAFLVAMTPILLAAAFIPGTGWTMVKSYIHITVWLALWLPVLGIINFIVTLYAQGQMGGALGGTGGYSMQSMALVDGLTSHLVLAGGFLATLTPLITWALVKGSFAFTEFLADGLGSRMANLAGSIAATGNISLGNESFGNESMNQRMLASTTIAGTDSPQIKSTDGQGQFSTATGGFVQRTPAGTVSRSASVANSASIRRSEAISQNASARASTEESSSLNQATQASRDLSSTLNQNTNAGDKISNAQVADLQQKANSYIDASLKSGSINAAQAQKDKAIVATATVGGSGGSSGGGKGVLGIIGVASSLFSANAKENITNKNDLTSKFSTDSSGGKGVKADQAASLQNRAQTAQDAAQVFSALQGISEKVGSTASQGFKKAASLSQSAATDYRRSVTASNDASRSASETGSFAYSSEQAARTAATNLGGTAGKQRGGDPLTDLNVNQQVDGVDGAVDPKVQGTPNVTNANKTTAVAGAAASAAQTATAGAQGKVSGARQKLATFKKQQAAMQAQLKSAQGTAASGLQSTSNATGSRLDGIKTAATNLQQNNKSQVSMATGKIGGSANSLNPVNMTSPSGDTGSLGADAAAVAAGAGLGGAKGYAGYKAYKKAEAEKAAKAAAKDAKAGGSSAADGAAAEGGTAAADTAGAAAAESAGGSAAADAAVPLADAAVGRTGLFGLGAVGPEATLLTGSATAVVGLGVGLYAGNEIDKMAGWPTLGDSIQALRIENAPGPDLKASIIPSSADLNRRFNLATGE